MGCSQLPPHPQISCQACPLISGPAPAATAIRGKGADKQQPPVQLGDQTARPPGQAWEERSTESGQHLAEAWFSPGSIQSSIDGSSYLSSQTPAA